MKQNRVYIKNIINKEGETVTLSGWVDSRRDHGKLVFLDIRDRTGTLQLVVTPKNKEAHEIAQDVRDEWVIQVTGTIKKRPDNMVNDDIPTGAFEMPVEELNVLNKSETPPFPINSDGYNISEELRLKYRYLDLRRERMKHNLDLRSKVNLFIRNYLSEKNFTEVETPMLTKATPEGARDFLVPSRLYPGKFYALPQSPQQYKQLLMVAGVEKYFQLARCFRDEDPRADRAYGEFTQLDMEMSFVDQEDILQLTEDMFTKMIEELFPEKKISQKPWPRLSHKEAMEKYGTDKPDLRKDKNNPNELAFAWTLDFPLFNEQTEEDYFHGSGKAKFAPSHHMFTAPHPDDIELLDKDPMKVRGLQHDMVLNGYEVGGGSIRIHNRKIQEKIFDLIGFTKKQQKQFSHILEAFTYGVPPHGGIAPGMDRLLMVILGEPSLREVMAFPTSGSGTVSVMDAPTEAEEEQLKELGIKILKNKKDNE
ncbi:MAG: aspartate--tRNA ligase [Candidatus Spechtbacterales bacterium]|nr:aspartate--tRNA ligase [Candidatus Spechtbacterales bacterium]